MNGENDDDSTSCGEIGTGEAGSDSVPIRAPGIGTRISDLSEVIGGRPFAAHVMRVSPATLQRYVSEKNMPPFDVAARLCRAAKARMEWLATGEGEMYEPPQMVRDEGFAYGPDEASHPVRRIELTVALQLAAEALGEKELPAGKHAALVSLIYELLVEGLPEAKVLRFARDFAA